MANNHRGWLMEMLEYNRRVAHHAAYKDLTDDQQEEVAERVANDQNWKSFMDEWAATMFEGKDPLTAGVDLWSYIC